MEVQSVVEVGSVENYLVGSLVVRDLELLEEEKLHRWTSDFLPLVQIAVTLFLQNPETEIGQRHLAALVAQLVVVVAPDPAVVGWAHWEAVRPAGALLVEQ